MPGGDRGPVSWPARSAEFRDHIAVTVGIGAQLRTPVFNALYGNRVDGVATEEQDELAVRNVEELSGRR
jgi:hydroxypyruvate isomerase